ncbi:MAG: pseudaminic acid cytidylyltransferase [Gammaproteobacteria bacterium]|nr:pseudaminic acid cytidylyltransferase [Gammaproteobacteria bacterium]
MNLAIIPARGGSKRIPRKNIKDFHGKPMIAYAIQVALNSKLFDHVVVSTDDVEIAHIAKSYGAQIPFMRPDTLADDFTDTVSVVAHAIEHVDFLDMHEIKQSTACCVYPCSPLINESDLQKAMACLLSSSADYCVPIVAFEHSIYRAMKIIDGKLSMLQPEQAKKRTQDLPVTYHDSGQFYFGRVEAWLKRRPILSGDAVPYVMARSHAVDIDTDEDWRMAERLYELSSRD